LRIAQEPVRELEKLRGKRYALKNVTAAQGDQWLQENDIAGGLWEFEIELEAGNQGGAFEFRFFRGPSQETKFTCDFTRRMVTLDRVHSGRTAFHPKFASVSEGYLDESANLVSLRCFLDSSSIEVFTNHGQTVLSELVFPEPSRMPVEVWSENDSIKIRKLTVWKLNSVVPISEAAK
jgi:sucrose-6-phosphate hydrolase SacC (GH32 family)